MAVYYELSPTFVRDGFEKWLEMFLTEFSTHTPGSNETFNAGIRKQFTWMTDDMRVSFKLYRANNFSEIDDGENMELALSHLTVFRQLAYPPFFQDVNKQYLKQVDEMRDEMLARIRDISPDFRAIHVSIGVDRTVANDRFKQQIVAKMQQSKWVCVHEFWRHQWGLNFYHGHIKVAVNILLLRSVMNAEHLDRLYYQYFRTFNEASIGAITDFSDVSNVSEQLVDTTMTLHGVIEKLRSCKTLEYLQSTFTEYAMFVKEDRFDHEDYLESFEDHVELVHPLAFFPPCFVDPDDSITLSHVSDDEDSDSEKPKSIDLSTALYQIEFHDYPLFVMKAYEAVEAVVM